MKPQTYYHKDRSEFLEILNPGTYPRVLEVGCGAGSNVGWYRDHGASNIVGIELDATAAEVAAGRFDTVHCGRVEDVLDILEPAFDLIVCADVLEHLVEPGQIVARLVRLATPHTALAVSIPNIRHYRALIRIAVGAGFRYDDEGTFDSTHLRFFARKNIRDLLQDNGWRVKRWSGLRAGRFGRLAGVLHLITLGWADEYLTYQWHVMALPSGERSTDA